MRAARTAQSIRFDYTNSTLYWVETLKFFVQ
jgi:hypothetical protein